MHFHHGTDQDVPFIPILKPFTNVDPEVVFVFRVVSVRGMDKDTLSVLHVTWVAFVSVTVPVLPTIDGECISQGGSAVVSRLACKPGYTDSL